MPRPSGRTTSLTRKLLAVCLPLVSLSVLVLFSAIEYRSYLRQVRALKRGVQELVLVQGAAYTNAVWEYNDEQLDALLDELQRTPHFRGAVVHDSFGEVLARAGEVDGGDPDLRAETALVYETEHVREEVGRLAVAFRRDRIYGDLRERLLADALVELVLILTIVGATVLATRRFMIRPIGMLRERVLRIADGATDVSVDDVRTGDEIEELAGAFSTMQRKVVDRERKLETSRETTLTQLLESAPDAMIVVSTEGAICRFNTQASALFGYGPEELAGMNVTNLMPERFRDGHGAHMATYFADPNAREMGAGLELLGSRKDGSEFPLEIGLSPFDDPEGLMAVAAIRDITERRRAEAELRKLNQAVEQGSAIVFITDPDGTIEYVNPRFIEVTGYTAEEAIGKSPRLLSSGVQDPSIYDELWSTLQVGRDWRGEFCNRKKDGSLYWAAAAISPIRDGKGKTTHFVAIQDDITARKEAAEELDRQEERFRTLVANLPETIYRCLHDEAWTMEFISEDVEDLTGYAASDFIHNAVRTYDSVIHPDDRAMVADEVAAAVRAKTPWSTEYRIVRADGSTRWAGERGRAIFDEKGQVEYLDGVIADITERKAMQDEIKAAREQAEAANQAKSDFLSHMSHELRTPLNGVLGYAQILQRDPGATTSQKESLRSIVSCGSHLLALINDVLDLSKIEAGRVDIDEAPCDLSKLLRSVGDVVEQRARAKGLSFETKVSPEVPQGIVTDAAKVRQVLVNLLGNAVKFTAEGGVVHKVTETPKGRLRFQVEDTGVGMNEAELEDIFDPFKQVDAGKAAGGTGLGLAISQRLVEALGGTLEVTSEKGKGSVFTVALPLVEAETEDLGALDAEGALEYGDAVLAPGQECTVLVADDRETNRDILDQMLRASGITPLIADDGDTALELLRKHDEIDLVLMDVRMPRMNGLEAVKQIRADEKLKDVKVIAVTASVFPEFREKAIKAGFDDFLGKPFRTEELIQKLKKHLDAAFVDAAAPAADETPPPEGDAEISGELAASVAGRIREALKLGNVTALNKLAAELNAERGAASSARKIGELARAFDFAGLGRLADELEEGAGE